MGPESQGAGAHEGRPAARSSGAEPSLRAHRDAGAGRVWAAGALERVGIVGFGAFGRLLAGVLSAHAPVLVFDARSVEAEQARRHGAVPAALSDVCASGVVIFAVTAEGLRGALALASAHLAAGALVADVCSVKVGPVAWMTESVPARCDVLGTHPLFGPQTLAETGGVGGLTVALCPVRVGDQRLAAVEAFLGGALGLRVVRGTPEEHDRVMARVQAVTQLVGQAALELGYTDHELATLGYRRLVQLGSNVAAQSEALFMTIQRHNPYAAQERARFRRALGAIEGRIGGDAHAGGAG